MKLNEMSIKQILEECDKHIIHNCRHCPFCKDIWEIEEEETGAKDYEVNCEVRGILDTCEEHEKEEYDI